MVTTVGLRCGRFTLELGRRTLIMGILNVTPDSFSDGGRYGSVEAAVARALAMVGEGADIVDVGGESTRPGADPVDADEEAARVLPVIRALAGTLPVPVSVDTSKASVARAALEAGAAIVNDVWGLQGDPAMAAAVAGHDAAVVAMHNQREPVYQGDLIEAIMAFFRRSLEIARRAGIPDNRVILDPGFGFGKTTEHNLEVTGRLSELCALGRPLLLGPSRKSTIGRVLDLPVDQRVEGTAAVVALAVAQGVDIVRVHDVREMARVARMADAVVRRYGFLAGAAGGAAAPHPGALEDPAPGRPAPPPVTAYLGLGSNLGDREANLRRVLSLLAATPGVRVRRVSAVYETEPVGFRDQPWFLNQVVEVETDLAPRTLLTRALEVEAALGRVRRERWGPRVIDIDILLYGELTMEAPGLTLPHPRLADRAFALVPLAELAPARTLPGGRTAAELAARALAEGPGVRRW